MKTCIFHYTHQLSVILSDGSYFIQSMLATQLNHFVENHELDKNVLIKLTNYVTNSVQNRK
jgi:replication factor A1